jgi:hypothetical protein
MKHSNIKRKRTSITKASTKETTKNSSSLKAGVEKSEFDPIIKLYQEKVDSCMKTIESLQPEIDERQKQVNDCIEKVNSYNDILTNLGVGNLPKLSFGGGRRGRKLRVGWNERILKIMSDNPNKKFSVTELSDLVKNELDIKVDDKIVRSSVGSILSNGRKKEFIGQKEGRKYLYSLKPNVMKQFIKDHPKEDKK